MPKLAYRDALKQALTDAMREDPDILVIGEEVGRYGGAYGVTKGCLLYTSPSPRDKRQSRMPSSA